MSVPELLLFEKIAAITVVEVVVRIGVDEESYTITEHKCKYIKPLTLIAHWCLVSSYQYCPLLLV